MSTEFAWVPEACTLPSVEQPLRVAEFDTLFATALRDQSRPAATRLRLILDSAAEQTARELTERETACCSFFTFTVIAGPDSDTMCLDVEVPMAQMAVLTALADRAAELRTSA
jgi:hypothetical protein